MTAAIIDDNPQALKVLTTRLNKSKSNVKIIGTAQDVKSGIQLLNATSPDLVFLDIEMPDGTGFDLLNALENFKGKVIFTTSHDGYALKAFQYAALDYVLKPVSQEKLDNALNRIPSNQFDIQNQFELLQDVLKQKTREKMVLKDAESVHIVKLKEILFLEASSNYTTFNLKDGSKILVSQTMKEYENMLPQYFFRCHKSYLVNLNAVSRFDKKTGGWIVLENNAEIPVSTRKKESFLDALNQFI